MPSTLHYIFDPLCGWCYAASPLLRHAVTALGNGLTLQFHPGLMFDSPRNLGPDWRSYILNADQRIHQLTGVPFGKPYIDWLLSDAPMVLESTTPTLALLAARQLESSLTLDMLEAIQAARYQRGEDICDPAHLAKLAGALGFNEATFTTAMTKQATQLDECVSEARQRLHAAGGQGFPTFILETASGLHRLDHGRHYGNPQTFIDQIRSLTGATA
ncbi:DsbA family protein [Viridibacterium curvum]|uniref:DsbA family protein n=1 Tax=Viridibacterium curvum TaxID=1101404 RepID=A0ABP9QQE6_9RHOO